MSLIGSIEEGYVTRYVNIFSKIRPCIVLWVSYCKRECIIGCYGDEYDSREVSPLRRECVELTLESECNYSEKFNTFPLEEQIRKFGVTEVLKVKATNLISKYRFIETLKHSYNDKPKHKVTRA